MSMKRVLSGLAFTALGVVLIAALLAQLKALAKNEPVKVGDKAPDFTLPTQNGDKISLHDLFGKKSIVLYFYPKDETSVCTKEACLFRDSYEAFSKYGAEVLGVSSDSQESHLAFADHHKLPFKLLSDKDSSVRKLYGVPAAMGVVPGRVTYVIDKQGTVRLVFNSMMDADRHVSQALNILRQINQDADLAK